MSPATPDALPHEGQNFTPSSIDVPQPLQNMAIAFSPWKVEHLGARGRTRQDFQKDFTRRSRQAPNRPPVLPLRIMAEGRSRVWLWILIGGVRFFSSCSPFFSLVYVTMHNGDDGKASLTSFGDKIAVWISKA